MAAGAGAVVVPPRPAAAGTLMLVGQWLGAALGERGIVRILGLAALAGLCADVFTPPFYSVTFPATRCREFGVPGVAPTMGGGVRGRTVYTPEQLEEIKSAYCTETQSLPVFGLALTQMLGAVIGIVVGIAAGRPTSAMQKILMTSILALAGCAIATAAVLSHSDKPCEPSLKYRPDVETDADRASCLTAQTALFETLKQSIAIGIAAGTALGYGIASRRL